MIEPTINIGTFILEDDIEMHEVMRQTLEESGYNRDYHITHDPEIFLSKLSDADINICVLDHILNSVYTGLDIIKKVKQKNKWSYVIVMSGQAKLNIGIQYLNEGANKYIDKNWSETELKEMLKNCPKKLQHPTYLDILVKYLKEAFEEAKERVAIVKFLAKSMELNNG